MFLSFLLPEFRPGASELNSLQPTIVNSNQMPLALDLPPYLFENTLVTIATLFQWRYYVNVWQEGAIRKASAFQDRIAMPGDPVTE